MQTLRGLATGIGSLPFLSAAEAVEAVLRYCPEVPFWPQLPRRSVAEGMVAQFCEGLPCLRLAPGGIVFEEARKEESLERFYEKVIKAEPEHFRLSADAASGLYAFKERLKKDSEALQRARYLKCHITGPFTFAASIKDERQRPLLHDPVFMQAIVEGLAMKALWQIRFLQEFGKEIILFIDEPYLACFGSAFTSINKEDVTKVLSVLTERIHAAERVLVGVHCCGNTDWSIFTGLGHLDIINFDAFGFLERFVLYAAELAQFVQQGKLICWGIVPTQEEASAADTDALIRRLRQGINQLAAKGVKEDLLYEGLLVSPSCGLGTLEPSRAAVVLETLSKVSSQLRQAAE